MIFVLRCLWSMIRGRDPCAECGRAVEPDRDFVCRACDERWKAGMRARGAVR